MFYIEIKKNFKFLKNPFGCTTTFVSLFPSVFCSVNDFSSRVKLNISSVFFIPTFTKKDSIVQHELTFLVMTLLLQNATVMSVIQSLLHQMVALFFPKRMQPELARNKKNLIALYASGLYILRILPYIFIVLKDVF